MLYKTEGIVVKKNNLGETDCLLAIYTKDFGKLLLKAKAIRKNQAKLKGHLETFFYIYLMIAPARRATLSVAGGPARGFDIITGAEIIDSFSLLRVDLASLATAYYFAELIDKLAVGPEKDERLWQLLLISFKRLNQKNPEIKKIRTDFEEQILDVLGYGSARGKSFIDFVEGLLGQRINSIIKQDYGLGRT